MMTLMSKRHNDASASICRNVIADAIEQHLEISAEGRRRAIARCEQRIDAVAYSGSVVSVGGRTQVCELHGGRSRRIGEKNWRGLQFYRIVTDICWRNSSGNAHWTAAAERCRAARSGAVCSG